MPLHFKEITEAPAPFFDLLPPGWQEDIVPQWPFYQATARIFALKKQGEIHCAGIIFSTVSPDTQTYREVAQGWFDRGFLYIGFLFVPEKYRGKHYGTSWLEALEKQFPGQAFWLAIDEFGLKNFYQKNGFQLVKQVTGEFGPEWILERAANAGITTPPPAPSPFSKRR